MYFFIENENDIGKISNVIDLVGKLNFFFVGRCDEDFFRLYVFCFEYVVEVEKLFRLIGGVYILFFCYLGVCELNLRLLYF